MVWIWVWFWIVVGYVFVLVWFLEVVRLSGLESWFFWLYLVWLFLLWLRIVCCWIVVVDCLLCGSFWLVFDVGFLVGVLCGWSFGLVFGFCCWYWVWGFVDLDCFCWFVLMFWLVDWWDVIGGWWIIGLVIWWLWLEVV